MVSRRLARPPRTWSSRREEARRLRETLTGQAIPPALALCTKNGEPIPLAEYAERNAAIYLFPGDRVAQRGGDTDSPMADAAQHQGFRDRRDDLFRRGLLILGITSQPPESLNAISQQNKLAHALLSDATLQLADALRLPTIDRGDERVYRRLALVVRGGLIKHVFYPIETPESNADQVLAWARIEGR